MSLNNLVKRLQDIMRNDAGINGDAQRIEQIVWILFLKVYDIKEKEWALIYDKYQSIIPKELQWDKWACDKKDGKALTGDELLNFVNGKLFPSLKKIPIDENTPMNKAIIRAAFEDNNNYQKIMRYCDDALRDEVNGYINAITETINNKKYTNALEQMKQAKTSNDILIAAELFEEIKDYRDSGSLAKECREKKEWYQGEEIKNREYLKCKAIYEDAKDTKFYINQAVNNLEVAIESLKNLNGWGNSTRLIELCKQEIEIKKQRIQEEKEHEERMQRKEKIIYIILGGSIPHFV